jgi:hypothetical protein
LKTTTKDKLKSSIKIRHRDIQHHYTQHNNTEHYSLNCDTQYNDTRHYVIMPSIIMLSVKFSYCYTECPGTYQQIQVSML